MPDIIKNTLTANKKLASKILKKEQDNYNYNFDFNSIKKMPDGLTEEDAYKWVIDNWGTTSNAWNSTVSFDESTETFTITFETAWNPPVGIIEELALISENENFVWICIGEVNDILMKWTKDGFGHLIKTKFHHSFDFYDENVYQLMTEYDDKISNNKKL